MTNSLIFLDTETTGLDPDKHEVWELAYAFEGGGVHVHKLPHSTATADLAALDMNGYYQRGMIADPTPHLDLYLRSVLKDATIVGANPSFDLSFLRVRWGGVTPWHYRAIDIESMAVGVLGYDRPKGMEGISDDLRRIGYDIPEPDHSAAGDVNALREAYRALRNERDSYGKKL